MLEAIYSHFFLFSPTYPPQAHDAVNDDGCTSPGAPVLPAHLLAAALSAL